MYKLPCGSGKEGVVPPNNPSQSEELGRQRGRQKESCRYVLQGSKEKDKAGNERAGSIEGNCKNQVRNCEEGS